MSRATSLLLVVSLCLPAGTTGAAWEGDERPEFDNAYTLRDGEWQIGLFRPTGIGLADRLQLTTVLLGNLVGVFNGHLKFKILDTDFLALSVGAGGFYAVPGRFGGVGGRLRLTVPIGERFYLSAGAGYSWRSDPEEDEDGDSGDDGLNDLAGSSQEGIVMAAEAELLLNSHNILVWNIYADYRVDDEEFGSVLAGFYYAHCWDTFRLMVGAVFKSGNFVFRDKADNVVVDTPVLPWIDLWWRW